MNAYQKQVVKKNGQSLIHKEPEPRHFSSALMHYNHNHDKLGRFARSNGTSGLPKAAGYYGKYSRRNVESKDLYKAAKKLYKDYEKSNMERNGFRPKRETENRSKVAKDARNVLKNDKEYQKLSTKYDDINDKALEAEIAFYETVDSDDDTKKIDAAYSKYDKLQSDLYKAEEAKNKRRDELTDRYLGQYAEAVTKDLKITNNKEVKDFIIRNAVDDWMSEKNPGMHSSFLEDTTDRQKQRKDRVENYSGFSDKEMSEMKKAYSDFAGGPEPSSSQKAIRIEERFDSVYDKYADKFNYINDPHSSEGIHEYNEWFSKNIMDPYWENEKKRKKK